MQEDNLITDDNKELLNTENDKLLQTNTNNIESLKIDVNTNKDLSKGNWGGARINAGRPFGSKNTATLHKEKIRRALEQRILRHADRLANAQLKLALGGMYLFRIDTITNEKGQKIKQRPVLVEDIEEIIDYLDWAEADGQEVNDDYKYYFITAKDPDGRAIENLLDRTFGKPIQGIAIETDKSNEFEQLTDEQLDEQIRLLEGTISIEGEKDEGTTVEGDTD